jgi:hypothetical protein
MHFELSAVTKVGSLVSVLHPQFGMIRKGRGDREGFVLGQFNERSDTNEAYFLREFCENV